MLNGNKHDHLRKGNQLLFGRRRHRFWRRVYDGICCAGKLLSAEPILDSDHSVDFHCHGLGNTCRCCMPQHLALSPALTLRAVRRPAPPVLQVTKLRARVFARAFLFLQKFEQSFSDIAKFTVWRCRHTGLSSHYPVGVFALEFGFKQCWISVFILKTPWQATLFSK